MNTQLKGLIDLFLNKVSEAESIMKSHFGISEPRMFRKSNIDRMGKFGQYEYSFHGVGCCFSFKDIDVDYDYGVNGRIDGFDLWRLSRFGEQLEAFKNYVACGELKADFESSFKDGEIKQSSGKYDRLYYLSEL